MSTPANALTDQQAPQQPPQQGGFFSRLGAGLKKVMPYVTPIANRLAAAAGNYGPLELEHQQKELELQQAHERTQEALAQSQMQNQELNRQLLQKNIANVRTPEETQAAAIETKKAETPQNYLTPEGSIGVSDYDLQTHEYKPRTITSQVPNPAFQARAALTQAGAGLQSEVGKQTTQIPGTENIVGPQEQIPPIPPSVTGAPPLAMPPVPETVPQKTPVHVLPPASLLGINYSPAGIDMDPHSPTYGQSVQYQRNKMGQTLGTVPAPGTRGTLDVTAPMVTESERAVTQPTGEITKETFKTSRQRLLPGQSPTPAPSSGGGSSPQAGNLGHGPAVGGKVPTPVTQAFANVQDARNRVQTMLGDLDAINKNPTGNVGSMDMDLFSQHVALTFGTVKNARGGEALIMHHINARSLPENLVVMYQHLKNGGVLSPEQRQNFIATAQLRLKTYEDQYQKAQQEAQQGFGMNPNAPSTMPGTGGFAAWDKANPPR